MNFPKPKFDIGDIVRVVDNGDPDEIAMVVGIRLRYYHHMRRHVWYYELADKISAPSVTNEWLSDEEVAHAEAKTARQKWHIDGGEVPVREMVVCWNCYQYRVDDGMDCPHCSALGDDGMDTKASAVEMAQSLNIDDAVRTIARTDKNHVSGPNWYGTFEGLEISATFGAGTNSADVICPELSSVFYHADEYGKRITAFRYGPWVHRLLAKADELRKENEAKRLKDKKEAAQRQLDNFKEVDF